MNWYRIACVAAPLALTALSSSANAAGLAYLECVMPSGNGGIVWQIALDENAKTVTFKHSEAQGMRPGVFTPDMVTWNEGRFSISRIDLSFSRTWMGITDKGKCKVVTPPKRAF